MLQRHMLFETQLRAPSGAPSRSKWAKGLPAAGSRDFIRAGMRVLQELAYSDDAHAAAARAGGLVRVGEWFGTHQDDKAPATGSRVTIFNVAPGAPSTTVPPPPTGLSAAEGPYEEIREEDAP